MNQPISIRTNKPARKGPVIQHSGHGITATVLGSLAICIFLLNITLWLYFRIDSQMEYFHQVFLVALGCFNLVIILFGLIGSVKGLLQSGRNKTLPLIGMGLNFFALSLYAIIIGTYLFRKYF
jgi:hypothetical protein